MPDRLRGGIRRLDPLDHVGQRVLWLEDLGIHRPDATDRLVDLPRLVDDEAGDRIEIAIERPVGGDPLADDSPRHVRVMAVGERWAGLENALDAG